MALNECACRRWAAGGGRGLGERFNYGGGRAHGSARTFCVRVGASWRPVARLGVVVLAAADGAAVGWRVGGAIGGAES